MARINLFGRYLFAAAFLAAGISCARPAMADDSGLLVPLDEDKPPATNGGKATSHAAAPAYPGLTADTPATTEPSEPAPPAATPQMTPVLAPPLSYTPSVVTPGIINDLGMASAVYGGGGTLKPPQADFSKTPHMMIHGKIPLAYGIETEIERVMTSLNDKKLSRSDRSKIAKDAYNRFSSIESALRMKQQEPDSMYKSMGFTDTYIQEEKDGTADALSQIDAALKTLKPLQ